MRRVGPAFNGPLANASAFGVAVTNVCALAANRAEELHKLRVVSTSSECTFNRFEISASTVAGQLNAICKAQCQILYGPRDVIAVATTDEIGQDHPAGRVDSDLGSCIERTLRRILCGREFLCLA